MGRRRTGRRCCAARSRAITRAKVLEFLASQPRCLVVMETCGGAHHWGREIQQLRHEVRLIPPSYVKAFAKRHKSDARDAAAIVEAAQRPTMRFVAVKTHQAQHSFDPEPSEVAALVDQAQNTFLNGGTRHAVAVSVCDEGRGLPPEKADWGHTRSVSYTV